MEPVHKLLQPSLGGDEDDDDLSVKGILPVFKDIKNGPRGKKVS